MHVNGSRNLVTLEQVRTERYEQKDGRASKAGGEALYKFMLRNVSSLANVIMLLVPTHQSMTIAIQTRNTLM